MRGVTLAQVAAHAGVSQPTASRVLNGSSRKPAPHVVEAVRRAAAELGYIPNAQAQALVRSSTGLLGLVVQDITDPYFSQIAAGVQEVARASRRQVMLGVASRDPEYEVEMVQTFVAHRADAIVIAPSHLTSPEAVTLGEQLDLVLTRYAPMGARVAFVGTPRPHAHAVVPQNREGATSLAEALVEQGHDRFLVLAGSPDLLPATDRAAGFLAGLARHGRDAAVVPSAMSRDGAYEAAASLAPRIAAGELGRPCIFAVTDVMALGALTALRERGVSVPGDAFIAGFDDIVTLQDHAPGLTTVRLPLAQMGSRAADLALAPTADDVEFVVERVAGEVILRESTQR